MMRLTYQFGLQNGDFSNTTIHLFVNHYINLGQNFQLLQTKHLGTIHISHHQTVSTSSWQSSYAIHLTPFSSSLEQTFEGDRFIFLSLKIIAPQVKMYVCFSPTVSLSYNNKTMYFKQGSYRFFTPKKHQWPAGFSHEM